MGRTDHNLETATAILLATPEVPSVNRRSGRVQVLVIPRDSATPALVIRARITIPTRVRRTRPSSFDRLKFKRTRDRVPGAKEMASSIMRPSAFFKILIQDVRRRVALDAER